MMVLRYLLPAKIREAMIDYGKCIIKTIYKIIIYDATINPYLICNIGLAVPPLDWSN